MRRHAPAPLGGGSGSAEGPPRAAGGSLGGFTPNRGGSTYATYGSDGGCGGASIGGRTPLVVEPPTVCSVACMRAVVCVWRVGPDTPLDTPNATRPPYGGSHHPSPRCQPSEIQCFPHTHTSILTHHHVFPSPPPTSILPHPNPYPGPSPRLPARRCARRMRVKRQSSHHAPCQAPPSPVKRKRRTGGMRRGGGRWAARMGRGGFWRGG